MTVLEALRGAGVDTEATIYRFGGNQILLEKFVRKFPHDETYSSLMAAVKVDNVEKMKNFAHTLKGTAANLGFEELSNRCAALVSALRNGSISVDVTEPLVEKIKQEYKKIIDIILRIE